jgi:hypothetical protein
LKSFGRQSTISVQRDTADAALVAIAPQYCFSHPAEALAREAVPGDRNGRTSRRVQRGHRNRTEAILAAFKPA